MRSEGQRLLCEVKQSLGEIAYNCGVTKQAVAEWKLGRKSPGSTSRAALWSAYEIPAPTWARMPSDPNAPEHASSTRTVVAHVEPVVTNGNGHPASSPSSLDQAGQLLAKIRSAASAGDLLPTDRVRLADSETKILALQHRMQKEVDLLEDRIVREHPTWRRIRETLSLVLSRHPIAAAEVADALDKLGV